LPTPSRNWAAFHQLKQGVIGSFLTSERRVNLEFETEHVAGLCRPFDLAPQNVDPSGVACMTREPGSLHRIFAERAANQPVSPGTAARHCGGAGHGKIMRRLGARHKRRRINFHAHSCGCLRRPDLALVADDFKVFSGVSPLLLCHFVALSPGLRSVWPGPSHRFHHRQCSRAMLSEFIGPARMGRERRVSRTADVSRGQSRLAGRRFYTNTDGNDS